VAQERVISVSSRKPCYFVTADSAIDFFTKGEENYSKLSNDVREVYENKFPGGRVRDVDWYGGGKTEDSLKFQNLTAYNSPETLTEFKDNFKDLSANIDTGGAFDKRKLIATRNKSGIFDFGLASKGLLRQVEWFSSWLYHEINEKRLPNPFLNYGVDAGVIPSDFVETKYLNGFRYMVWVNKGLEHTLQKRQAGVSKALNENPNLATYLAPGGIYTLVKPNKHLKFSSNYDKCYLQFTTSEKNDKTVDLFVQMGGSAALNSKSFAWKVMPALIVAEILTEAGIKVRINGAFMLHSMSDKNQLASSYVIKDYHEGFDWNKLLLNAADTRTIRYNVFRSLSANIAGKYPTQKDGKAWSADDGQFNGMVLFKGTKEFIELSERLKIFLLDQQKKGLNKTKTTDPEKMIFTEIGQINNNDSLETLTGKALVEINRVLTKIDFAYNSAAAVVKRTQTKMKEQGKRDFEISRFLKNTIEENIQLPTSGEYKYDIKEQELALEKYNRRMAAIEEVFKDL
jgi:hypothetical protein